MSDGTISQDEIDALLSGVDMGGLSSGGSSSTNKVDIPQLEKFISGEKDKLANTLNSMTGAECSVGDPVVESSTRDQLLAKLPEMVVATMCNFNAGLQGEHLLILSHEFSQKITSLINKEENAELDDMALSVISEVISSHNGSLITDLCSGGRFPGLACDPAESVNVPKAMAKIPESSFVLYSYPVTLAGESYTLWEVTAEKVAVEIADTLSGVKAMKSNPVPSQSSSGGLSSSDMASLGGFTTQGQMNMGGMGMNMGMQQPMGGGMGMNMGMQQPMGGMGMAFGAMPNVQSVQYPTLQGGSGIQEQGNIGLIMDVFMEMTVELGRTKKQIKEILGMGEGTIIELDKLAGEPVDILVNHKPIAKGEVVVIDENFGVRVTEILSPIERVNDLH